MITMMMNVTTIGIMRLLLPFEVLQTLFRNSPEAADYSDKGNVCIMAASELL
jgi:hypothetical protein